MITVLKMYDIVDQVKVHKVTCKLTHLWVKYLSPPQQRCKHLRNQCAETLNALRDTSSYVEGSTEMKEAIDVFES